VLVGSTLATSMQMGPWTRTIPAAALVCRVSSVPALLASTLAGIMQVDIRMPRIRVVACIYQEFLTSSKSYIKGHAKFLLPAC
jgi:hypothetical protein